MTASFREKLIHKNLKACFPSLCDSHFLFLLGTSNVANNVATYSYDHVFLSSDGRYMHTTHNSLLVIPLQWIKCLLLFRFVPELQKFPRSASDCC